MRKHLHDPPFGGTERRFYFVNFATAVVVGAKDLGIR